MKYALIIKYLLLTISLSTISCTFDTSSIKTSPIVISTNLTKQVYENLAYSNQKITFLSAGNLLAIADSSDVLIINLKDNSVVNKLKTSDSMITSSFASKNGDQFFLSTDMSAQIWDTKSWKLLKQFNAKQLSKLSGISPKDDILYFDASLWSLDTHERVKTIGEELDPGSYDFSSDSQYFMTSEHRFGVVITHINDKSDGTTTNRINSVDKTKFRTDNNYYASYDAKFIVEQGGYRARTFGLFDIKNNNLIKSYAPDSRITCWTVDDNNGVLISLFNGDVALLNNKLDITHKWHIDNGHIVTCEKGKNNDIWLGSINTGLFKADLTSNKLTKTYQTDNMITDLEISTDNKKLGVVEAITGGSIVKVFELKR